MTTAAALYAEIAAAKASPRDLARLLGGAGLDVASAKTAAGHAVVLAEGGPGDPVLLAQWLAPGVRTPLHDHGSWGAFAVVEGEVTYDRFTPVEGSDARWDTTFWLRAGDTIWWNGPPDDVHRQVSRDGALELVLLGGAPSERSYLPEPSPGGLVAAYRAAYESGSVAPLASSYAEDVLVDLCVPAWRFQVQGREAALAVFADEEFAVPGYRLRSFRGRLMPDGAVVEADCRFEHDGEERGWRDLHVIRTRDGLVTEATVYCTGHWDADAIARQAVEAPMIRP